MRHLGNNSFRHLDLLILVVVVVVVVVAIVDRNVVFVLALVVVDRDAVVLVLVAVMVHPNDLVGRMMMMMMMMMVVVVVVVVVVPEMSQRIHRLSSLRQLLGSSVGPGCSRQSTWIPNRFQRRTDRMLRQSFEAPIRFGPERRRLFSCIHLYGAGSSSSHNRIRRRIGSRPLFVGHRRGSMPGRQVRLEP